MLIERAVFVRSNFEILLSFDNLSAQSIAINSEDVSLATTIVSVFILSCRLVYPSCSQCDIEIRGKFDPHYYGDFQFLIVMVLMSVLFNQALHLYRRKYSATPTKTDMSESKVAAAERFCVGYALQPKKVETFIQPSLLDNAKQHGIDLVPIHATIPLREQGPFHCIIHKLHTQNWNQQLREFSAKHPNTIIIDPPELVNRLHNRVSMLEAVTHLQISFENATVGVPKQVVVNEPEAFDFDRIEEMGLRFPVIAKPLMADGSADSHKLCLVFDRDGFNALTVPTVLQEFVNHGGIVFKIYVAGQSVNCVKRKSLADISEEKLRTLKGALPFCRVSNLSEEEDVENAEMPPQSLIGELARALREALGLNLFNVDVIRDAKDRRRYFVIDINYFPGYAKMPSYEPFITNFLLDVLRTKTA
ncbi:hypothetical protein VNO77_24688 [Canavalia gladiata]|uniref:ATP-grasp domain-containing protein n=1 Tax=Canavalia gladiata TaxID=3824 RepID=A0AAN9LA40_CANGL